ncbi:hypothetical protein BB561_001359 [Smittium simulii]|uniref:Pentacotripeptide-repeat region of PRORP domain-containing protein n=1 Tax=Smittium simulii TaxID=133385 RepID=A0A2T9YV29_9FUNG|nr:hypothetical protein BB561_001359 [Smittium simulii]
MINNNNWSILFRDLIKNNTIGFLYLNHYLKNAYKRKFYINTKFYSVNNNISSLDKIYTDFRVKRDTTDDTNENKNGKSDANKGVNENVVSKPTIFSENLFSFMNEIQMEDYLPLDKTKELELKYGFVFETPDDKIFNNKIAEDFHYVKKISKAVIRRDRKPQLTRFLKKSHKKLAGFLDKKIYYNYTGKGAYPDSDNPQKTREYNSVLLEFEENIYKFPFTKKINNISRRDERKKALKRKSYLPNSILSLSDLWNSYSNLINNFDKKKILIGVNFSALQILIDLFLRFESTSDPNINRKNAIQIIEDLIDVQRGINSTFLLNTFLFALNSTNNYNDTIFLLTSLIQTKKKQHDINDTNLNLKISSEHLDFRQKFCTSFQNTELTFVSINCLVHAYLEVGNLKAAFEIYNQMPGFHKAKGRVYKNSRVYSMMYKAFLYKTDELKDIPKLNLYLNYPKKILKDLLLDYKKSKKAQRPLIDFDLNSLTLNVMLDAAVKNRKWYLANLTFCKLVGAGVIPDQKTLTILSQGLISMRKTHYSSALLDPIYSKKLSTNILKLFEIIYHTNSTKKLIDTVFATVFINFLIQIDDIHGALKIYNIMLEKYNNNMRPSIITCTTLLNGLADFGLLLDAVKCYNGFIAASMCYPSTPMLVAMYKVYLKQDPDVSFNKVTNMLNSTHELDLNHIHVVMANYVYEDKLDSALELFNQMITVPGFKPNCLTFYLLFNLYNRASLKVAKSVYLGYPLNYQTKIGLDILRNMSKQNPNSEMIKIIENPHHPRQIFNYAIQNKISLSPTVYNLIISTLMGFSDQQGTQTVYYQMTKVARIPPGPETYSRMIKMFIRTLNVSNAKELLNQILHKSANSEFKLSLFIYNGLICETINYGLLDIALDLYMDMVGRLESLNKSNYSTYYKELSPIARKYKPHKNTLFQVKVLPDCFTYLYLFNGLLRENRTQETLELYEDMFNLGIIPNQNLTTNLINGLQKNDCMVEAVRIVSNQHDRIKRLVNSNKFEFE